MNDWPDAFRNKRDSVTIPTIWVTVALSLLIHGAALWWLMPRLSLLSPEMSERGKSSPRLTVQLAPLPSPRPAPAPSPALEATPPPPPKIKAKPPKTPRPRPKPPVMALNRPAPVPAAPVIAPAPSPPVGDMQSYIEARRRARSETTASAESAPKAPNIPPVEDENARRNRIVTDNLASQRPLTFGYDPSQGGGMFQIVRMAYDNADYLFFGWNKDIQRKTKQLIEVRKGNNSDIRIAVVRSMIALIREHEQGDFLWESPRLGRDIMLSARLRDNAGLEEFLMSDFFPGARMQK